MLENDEEKRPDFKEMYNFLQKNKIITRLDEKNKMEIESMKSSKKYNSKEFE